MRRIIYFWSYDASNYRTVRTGKWVNLLPVVLNRGLVSPGSNTNKMILLKLRPAPKIVGFKEYKKSNRPNLGQHPINRPKIELALPGRPWPLAEAILDSDNFF
jgi:hypothetical protein